MYGTLHCACPGQVLNKPLFPPSSLMQEQQLMSSSPDITKLSVMGQPVTIFSLWAVRSLSQLLGSATITRKQP